MNSRNPIRIVQVIDSLAAGGAERMAVSYANELAKHIAFSGLVATREEGNLKAQITQTENYLFLNRKNTIDFTALRAFKKYIKKNQVEVIHAHSSSIFFAVLFKLSYPKIKIVWHDHYGKSEQLDQRSKKALQLASFFMMGSIAVNEKLKLWADHHLFVKKRVYLANFTISTETQKTTVLEGIDGRRILCLANLRPQKDHLFLLAIAKKLVTNYPDWSFHLVGKDFNDAYSANLKLKIKELELEQHVFLYGSKNDIMPILEQASIGILTSNSEGLPVALLEYGAAKLPVVCTAVGEIPNVISSNNMGFLVSSGDVEAFYSSLEQFILSEKLRNQIGIAFHQKLESEYGATKILTKYLNWIYEK